MYVICELVDWISWHFWVYDNPKAVPHAAIRPCFSVKLYNNIIMMHTVKVDMPQNKHLADKSKPYLISRILVQVLIKLDEIIFKHIIITGRLVYMKKAFGTPQVLKSPSLHGN